MSKRTGQAITLNELIEEVGTDAARYFFIMRSLDTQLDFDLDLAKSHSNENPVYYIQYANARIFSIYKQIAENGDVFDMTWKNTKWDKLKEERELALIKKMAAYPEGHLIASLISSMKWPVFSMLFIITVTLSNRIRSWKKLGWHWLRLYRLRLLTV